jgi:hypothetical protein
MKGKWEEDGDGEGRGGEGNPGVAEKRTLG